MIILYIYIVIHIITGFMAYGLIYADLFFVLPEEKLNRIIAFLVAAFGPVGLLGAFLVNDSGFYFKYRD